MARLTWDDLIKQYQDQGYKIYDYRPMNAGKPASTWADATIGVHDSANSENAAPTNPSLNHYHMASGVWKGQPWVRFNRDPWQVGAGVFKANSGAGPQIAYAGPVGGKPGEKTQYALDNALRYLRSRAPELTKISGHGELWASDPRYSRHGRQMNEGSWASGWDARVNPTRTLTSAEAQAPQPFVHDKKKPQTTDDLIKLLRDGAEPPLPTQAPIQGTVLEDIVIDSSPTGPELIKTPISPYAPAPDASSAANTAKEPLVVGPNASTLPPGGYGEFTPRPQGGYAGEDLSPPAPAPVAPPLPATPGATPPRLRPDQTSNWAEWQHGQMQGALNTGPTQYVAPTQPKPPSQYNMTLAGLLGGLFK